MENKASITALMSAFARAYHTESSRDTVFSDPIARLLLTDEEYRAIGEYLIQGIDFFAPDKKNSFNSREEMLSWIVETQIAPTPLARAKFCEDSLKTAVMTGTEQLVILGAGMDTFAFREKELMKKLTVFETDHPKTQEDKISRIKRAGLEIPEGLKFIPVDFSADELEKKLIRCGFDRTKKTFFSWLGVSYYLTEKQISDTLKSIYSLSADGSTVVFDLADSLEPVSERFLKMTQIAAAGGEPMKFSADYATLEKLLEKNHFLIYEALSTDEIQDLYFSERQDNLKAFENISYILAVVKKMQNTKENILQTALTMFSQYGYEAVSVRDIAGRLGMTQAALYKHYKNKRDIFDSILRRMEREDYERAESFGVPEDELLKMEKKYKSTQLTDIKNFAEAQFLYWTEDTFASKFRRMLMIERFGSKEMSELHRNYLGSGVIGYLEDLFREHYENYRLCALRFYAPIYTLISLYDEAEDKEDIVRLAKKHIADFCPDKLNTI